MFKFIKKKRKFISAIITLLFFIFLISSQIDHGKDESWFSATVQVIVYPLQSVSHYIQSSLLNTWKRYFWLVEVQQKNELLLKTIKTLQAENEHSVEIMLENNRLRKILEFQKRNTDKKIFAEVIGEIRKGFSQLLIINKGAHQKIRRNFAVVSNGKIVGKIQSVTGPQSIVQLITDPQSKVPALIQRNRTKTIVSGSYDGVLMIDRVVRTLRLKKGDKVVTSGLAGIYPKGFLVGRINEVKKRNYGLFQSVTLTLGVDLNRIEDVAVILESVNNIQKPLFTEEAD